MTFDREMWEAVLPNPNLCVPWYLMASYAYYELDDPILSDSAFDELAKYAFREWKDIKHRHKHLISKNDLKAGSLLTRDCPEITKGAVRDLMSRRTRRRAPSKRSR